MEEKFSNWTEIFFDKLAAWWVALIANLPNIIVAALVAVAFYFLAKFIRKFISRYIPRVLGKHSVNSLFSNIAYTVVLIFGLFITLSILNLNQAVTSLLAGAGILGLVLGFAFQDLSANFISGIFIALKRPFDVGQTIETNGFIGNVEEIQLRTTTIRTFQGLHLMIPNKEIFQKSMINYSLSEERRIELEFNIPVDHDLKKIYTICKNAIDSLEYIVKTKPAEVYFTSVEDKVIKTAVWFWIYNHKPPGFMVARNDAIMNIMQALSNYALEAKTVSSEKQRTEPVSKEKMTDNHQNVNQ